MENGILEIGSYLKNYRGGRNECFMYGVDNSQLWYDYDLTSAYTTAMSILGDPDYRKASFIDRIHITKFSGKKKKQRAINNELME